MPEHQSGSNEASNQLNQYASAARVNRSNTTPRKILTTSQGSPVETLTASRTAGPQGPIVLEDFTLLDHISHFDRERIPERVVHAKGAGAFGYFEVTDAVFLSGICRAKMFQQQHKKTPVAVRFSTVGGESGTADTVRDPRGFAVKFYSEEGNWDLVGNNTPIFFLRDPILFPSFIHTQKRNPVTHLADADMFWDFIGMRPETTHQVSFLFSDRGIPDGYRFMNGYGSHTFKNVNAKGEAFYVKYHLKTDQGIRNLSTADASATASSDPDYAIRDLYNAIASGDYPSWTMYLQVMTFKEASQVSFNPFDLTKIWPHSLFPLHPVGRVVLNRNAESYFGQIEQLAFSPSHMIPGIEPSPDKMLQARLFSYPDTHRHRLGANYHLIPVNQAVAASVNTYQRDGPMQVEPGNGGPGPNYFPNSFEGPQATKAASWNGGVVSGQVQRYETGDDDNFSQVKNFYWRVLDEAARDRLTSNIAQHMSRVQSPFVRKRALDNCRQVDPDYADRIVQKLVAIQKRENQNAGRTVSQQQQQPLRLSPPRHVPPKDPPQALPTRPICPFGYSSKL
ncbi:hypothetical protein ACA910_014593 [Epithemia clementina (nom. ined.)]